MTGVTPTADTSPEVEKIVPFVCLPTTKPVGEGSGDTSSLLRPSGTSSPTMAREPAKPMFAESNDAHCAAPSPETIVAGSAHRAVQFGEEMRIRETLLRTEHAAEIADLTGRLLHARKAHAAHIEQLRTEHAVELRRLVEALWVAQDVARAALAQSGIMTETMVERPAQVPPTTAPKPITVHFVWLSLSKAVRILGRVPPTQHLWSIVLRTWHRARGRFGRTPW